MVLRHLAELLSEVIGSLYEIEDQIKIEQPHELCKQFIDSGNQTQVVAALNIYIGMFDKLFQEFMEVKEELMTIFKATLSSEDSEIAVHGLKAV